MVFQLNNSTSQESILLTRISGKANGCLSVKTVSSEAVEELQ